MTTKFGALLLVLVVSMVIFGCGGGESVPQKVVETSKDEPAAVTRPAPAPAQLEVMVGDLEDMTEDGSHLTVRTAKGASERIEVTPQTTFHNLKDGTKKVGKVLKNSGEQSLDLGEEGVHAVVHYTTAAGKKTAHVVKHDTKKAVQATEGVIHEVDKDARTVAVKTKEGATEVYDVAEDATVNVGGKLMDFGEWADKHGKKAGKSIFHFAKKGTKNVTHAIEHVADPLK